MPAPAPIIVAVTGAAGQIGYSLLPLIASGGLLANTPVHLRLLDVAPALGAARGVVLELSDTASPLLLSATATSSPAAAFAGAHIAILVGASPRGPGEERAALLAKNASIFCDAGAVLQRVAHPDVKVLVVGNPANTNALLLSAAAPRIPRANITALTRLDHNRAVGAVAARLGVGAGAVAGVAVWGNHSSTQYPDVTRVRVAGARVDAVARLGGREGVASDFIPLIQKRGAAIIAARGKSSALSAAAAIAAHVRDWLSEGERETSMAVCSRGEYGVEEGVWFSYPVVVGGGKWRVVAGIEVDDFSKKYIRASADELYAEKAEATAILAKL